ncbi:hypothetical protein NC651_021592 [Populus alba x Populus x berolinensis]|nr:hypothetical protein NC651_021592 [Populus alba x Populus x berolinensis]
MCSCFSRWISCEDTLRRMMLLGRGDGATAWLVVKESTAGRSLERKRLDGWRKEMVKVVRGCLVTGGSVGVLRRDETIVTDVVASKMEELAGGIDSEREEVKSFV